MTTHCRYVRFIAFLEVEVTDRLLLESEELRDLNLENGTMLVTTNAEPVDQALMPALGKEVPTALHHVGADKGFHITGSEVFPAVLESDENGWGAPPILMRARNDDGSYR